MYNILFVREKKKNVKPNILKHSVASNRYSGKKIQKWGPSLSLCTWQLWMDIFFVKIRSIFLLEQIRICWWCFYRSASLASNRIVLYFITLTHKTVLSVLKANTLPSEASFRP